MKAVLESTKRHCCKAFNELATALNNEFDFVNPDAVDLLQEAMDKINEILEAFNAVHD